MCPCGPTCPGPCPAASSYYASCAAFVSRRHKRYYCRWSSRWCCRIWTMATRRSPVYLATSSTDYSLWWTPLHNLFALSLRGSTSTSPATPLPSLAASARADIIEFKLSVLVFRCLHGTALSMVWRASYVVWRTWIQESGCDLNRRLPLSHHLRVVRRLVTARSSSLRHVPGAHCHPASLRLTHLAPSSIVWRCIFLPCHSLNFSKLRTSHFVLYFDFEKCSWSNL